MRKRALRSGELITVCDGIRNVGALMFDTPDDKVVSAPVGRFNFGIYIASARSELSNYVYAYVLDSASMRLGWCLDKLIMRP